MTADFSFWIPGSFLSLLFPLFFHQLAANVNVFCLLQSLGSTNPLWSSATICLHPLYSTCLLPLVIQYCEQLWTNTQATLSSFIVEDWLFYQHEIRMTERDSEAKLASEVCGHRQMVVALTTHLIVHLTALSPVPQPCPTPPVALPLILKLEHLDHLIALMRVVDLSCSLLFCTPAILSQRKRRSILLSAAWWEGPQMHSTSQWEQQPVPHSRCLLQSKVLKCLWWLKNVWLLCMCMKPRKLHYICP